jgi:hypothetical protein
MHISPRQLASTAILWMILGAGCGQGVQGDRSIPFSKDGGSIAFPNGREGVFVADPHSGKPRKVFEPNADVLAASTPLWSPAGRQLIFTTARLTSGQASPQPTEQDPAGSIFVPGDIVYSCWLRDEAAGADKAENIKLFDAACDHTGYVGANLAVRWHPKGDRILYIDQTGGHLHSLFEYTLATKQTARVFPHSVEALVFGTDPAGKSLIVAAGSALSNPMLDGLWLTSLENADWWHIPQSHELGRADIQSLIERLRATLPTWTKEGDRFAFVTSTGEQNGQPATHKLEQGNTAKREVEILTEGPEPFRDLHWSPDRRRLGFVRGREFGKLQCIQLRDKQTTEIETANVRRFAGWDDAGNHLAYVATETPPPSDSPWTTILLPSPGARDAVYLADADGKQPGKVVFSGLRVTFPQWSPTEETLSLWLTFSPTHRSLPSIFWDAGLRRGDPAATLDTTSGKITWMATNPLEKAQIGHYHLARREYHEASKWYAEAEADLPPAPPKKEHDSQADMLHPRDFSFFQYYCLTKLGRGEEAQAKWEQFQKLFTPPMANNAPPTAPARDPNTVFDWVRDLRGSKVELLRDLYMAEVFLSLNAVEDGQAFFEMVLKDAPDEEARARVAIVLSQVRLLRKQHTEYARMATDVLLPYLVKTWKPRTDGTLAWGGQDDSGLAVFAVLALAPLESPDFIASLPEEDVRKLLPRWSELRAQTKENVLLLGMDLILRSAYGRTGQEKEKQAAADRVRANPARQQLLPPDVEKSPVGAVRQAVMVDEQLVQLLRGF